MTLRIKTLQLLESLFGWIEQLAGRARERCAVCPDCGRNRYTDKPCIG